MKILVDHKPVELPSSKVIGLQILHASGRSDPQYVIWVDKDGLLDRQIGMTEEVELHEGMAFVVFPAPHF